MATYEACDNCRSIMSSCAHVAVGVVVVNGEYHWSGSAHLCEQCLHALIMRAQQIVRLQKIDDSTIDAECERVSN